MSIKTSIPSNTRKPGRYFEFDVTSAIVGDGTYSFGLLSGSTSLVTYSSTEASPPSSSEPRGYSSRS